MTKCLWQRGHRVSEGEHGEDSELWLVSILALPLIGAPQVELVAKNPPANAGDIRDAGLIPGSGRSPGEGNGNPLRSWTEEPGRLHSIGSQRVRQD